jgi:hypothetical protein
MKMVTKESVLAALEATVAIGQAIRELGSVSCGELYATLMGVISLETFRGALDILKRTNLVRESANQLTWVGEGAIK